MLLADANVLLDFALVKAISALASLESLEVLDVIVQETEVDERLPDLREMLDLAKVKIVQTEVDWLVQYRPFKTQQLSTPDALCLYYAKMQGRVLLTADKTLRHQSGLHGVTVHGHLWILEALFQQQLQTAQALCQWIDFWLLDGSRFPKTELENLRKQLGCVS